MPTKTETFKKIQLRKELPNIRSGDTVRVFQKIQEKEKDGKKRKVQSFEGIVIARKHGKGISATITVRKIISGIGVEKIFPIHSPLIEKIEILKRAKTRRSKLYYLRTAKGKKARLKRKDLAEAIVWEKSVEKPPDNHPEEKSANASPIEKAGKNKEKGAEEESKKGKPAEEKSSKKKGDTESGLSK